MYNQFESVQGHGETVLDCATLQETEFVSRMRYVPYEELVKLGLDEVQLSSFGPLGAIERSYRFGTENRRNPGHRSLIEVRVALNQCRTDRDFANCVRRMAGLR